MILILHNIRSLYNVGSIFRTADAAGVKKIYLCGITPAPVDRFGVIKNQFKKVSLGAEKYVKWEDSARSTRATIKLLEKLKKESWFVIAIEQAKNSIPYYRFKLPKKHLAKTVLIVGNEVKGLSASVLKTADKILEIPMLGRKESLNVSVAFGIVAYRLIFG